MRNLIFQLKKAYDQIFLYPTSSIDNGDVDYDAYWKDKRGSNIGAISDWQKNRADIVLKYIKDDHNITILDIGCGDGSVLKYLKEHSDISKTIGVDISGFALQKAREFGIETIQSDIRVIENMKAIPSVDYILLFEVLEHIQDSESSLRLMLEKAKGGVFFSFPNTGFITYRLRLLFGKFPLQWRIHPREHIRFWTTADLKWWLKAQDIKNYDISYYKGVPVLNRLLPSLFAAGFVIYIQTDDVK